jgi:hypothetical protein
MVGNHAVFADDGVADDLDRQKPASFTCGSALRNYLQLFRQLPQRLGYYNAIVRPDSTVARV